jgi:hypothetical protein
MPACRNYIYTVNAIASITVSIRRWIQFLLKLRSSGLSRQACTTRFCIIHDTEACIFENTYKSCGNLHVFAYTPSFYQETGASIGSRSAAPSWRRPAFSGAAVLHQKLHSCSPPGTHVSPSRGNDMVIIATCVIRQLFALCTHHAKKYL